MKFLQLTTLALVFMAASAAAQSKVSKAVISVPGAQCERCKSRIEDYVIRQYGVASISVNWRKQIAMVNWLEERTDHEQVKIHIANMGYDADDVLADEAAYKKLPPSCKHPVTKKSDGTPDQHL